VEIVTRAHQRDLEDEAGSALRVSWPEFAFHDAVAQQHSERVGRYFAEDNVLILEERRVAAGG